uniref:Uncharacterized protein n=1 Tax=Mola mola TaxID=94237 RepID=A0A3Q3XN46_MOLML
KDPNMIVCLLSWFLLTDFIGAKPTSDLQSMKQLLEEEMNKTPDRFSEEVEPEEKIGNTDKLVFGRTWDSSDPNNSALADKDGVLVRLFKDLMRTSRRSWSRYKKGGLRSCFGVRLERIGSFIFPGC